MPDRPAHDLRYGVDTAKIEGQLGWRPEVDMASGLRKTVAWYLDHEDWIKEIQERARRRAAVGVGWIPSFYLRRARSA